MIIKTIAACVASLSATGFYSLHAQQPDDCKKIIMEYIDNMASVQAPAPGEAYHIHFTTETLSADPRKTQSSTVEAHVYLDQGHMTYKTGQMVMMRDAQDAFMIIHPQRKIIWTKGGLNPAESSERMTLGTIQKKLVEQASLSYCRTEAQAGQNIRVIGLVPDKETSEKINVTSFVFYYDTSLKRMQKVAIDFAKSSPLKRQIITYHTIDFNYKSFKPRAYYAQVFAAQGKLHQHYQGYALVDNKNVR